MRATYSVRRPRGAHPTRITVAIEATAEELALAPAGVQVQRPEPLRGRWSDAGGDTWRISNARPRGIECEAPPALSRAEAVGLAREWAARVAAAVQIELERCAAIEPLEEEGAVEGREAAALLADPEHAAEVTLAALVLGATAPTGTAPALDGYEAAARVSDAEAAIPTPLARAAHLERAREFGIDPERVPDLGLALRVASLEIDP